MSLPIATDYLYYEYRDGNFHLFLLSYNKEVMMREFIRRSDLKTKAIAKADVNHRSKVINDEDILDLKIALELSEDSLDLLNDKHLFD